MRITDVRTVLLTGPCTNDPWLSECQPFRSAAFIEIITDTEHVGIGDSLQIKDGMVLPPERPGLGVELTDDVKNRFPFVPGSGEFNDFAGKNIVDYDGRVAQLVDTSKW